MSDALRISPTLSLPADELRWTAVRSGGAGGQNVNKVATKVQLTFDLAGSRTLPDPVKARLRRLARGRIDAQGALVVQADRTRSQAQNLELARRQLAELVHAALVAPKRRRATRPTRASNERRLEGKRQQASRKRDRRERPGD